MKLIYIKWCDACSNPGWFEKEEAKEWGENKSDWLVEQVGWVVEENDKYLVLAGRKGFDTEDPVVGQLQKIPKTWIIKKKIIKI